MRCKGHIWFKRRIMIDLEINTEPGGLNPYFEPREIEICWRCGKIRNIKQVK